MVKELKNIDQVFWDALQIEGPAQREAFLARACGDDEQLHQMIQKLIKAQPHAERFLEQPFRLAAMTEMPAVTEQPGTVIGSYKLLQQIGEGGFGVVFMAEQERPVRRRVALKIIKPGMDTREVIARFEAERQALAMMDHPNIAKVHDAGATENGRPYFVMELVQGVPITEYCDHCNLSTRERLELFVTVCQAVQHAHQKGVIHRDIKPTNVLVAMQDDRPAPKIIDFGVAKAIGQRLTEHTLMTAFAQMVGTPLYMSPEQAALSPLGVDTRSDIYSLGVLLYELLTGTTPFDKDRLHAASYDELQRIIREEEPPRPSTRISTLAADLASTVAEQRRTDARRLQQAVSGELDWIVMKCLEKDRNRRYETPNSLARDVERYLNDEPVQACPPSTAYRLKKFVRRHKGATAFAALLLVGVAALGVTNVVIKRERDAKAIALANAHAVSDLLYEMLHSASPHSLKGPDYTVRKLLDDFSARLENRLTIQPEVEAAIRTAVGKSYWTLGENEAAEPHLERALDLRRQIFGGDDERIADSLIDCVMNLGDLNKFAEAKTYAEDAIAVYQTHRLVPPVADKLADALYFLAVLQLRLGDEIGYRETCESIVSFPIGRIDATYGSRPIWTTCLAPDAVRDGSLPVRLANEFLADNSLGERHFRLFMLGAALYRAGQYAPAAQRLEESIDAYPKQPGHGFDTLNYQRLFLAMNEWQLGNRDEARRILDETNAAIEEERASTLTEWNRHATFELLRGEAEALIEPNEPNEAAENKGRISNEAEL